jgi:Protein of unknown function (DUF4232)
MGSASPWLTTERSSCLTSLAVSSSAPDHRRKRRQLPGCDRAVGVFAIGSMLLMYAGCNATQSSQQRTPDTAPSATTLPTAAVALSPKVTEAVPARTAVAAAHCEMAALDLNGRWQGATGALSGALIVTNTGSAICALQGRPQVRVVDASQHLLPVPEKPGRAHCEFVAIVCSPGSSVELASGQQAMAWLAWGNWCQAAPQAPLNLLVALPDVPIVVRSVPIDGSTNGGTAITPRCNTADEPSGLEVGPFERVS